MIISFADKSTAAVFLGIRAKTLPHEMQQRARERLGQLNAADSIEDLRIPPSNRLEKLSGNRIGQWSIRINKQWRVCFKFEGGNALDVEITDYH